MDLITTSPAFQIFAEAAETLFNFEMKKWKDNGGGIIGSFCSSSPDELVAAAGVFPFRMRATGSTSTELSDSCFSSTNCSFPRHAFDLALKGEFHFLDGLILYNSCDNVRRIYDHWVRRIKTPFVKILSLPRKADAAQVEWFRGELEILKEALESHLNLSIADGKLWETIKLYNDTRRLLRDLYNLRKGASPPITGAEALAVTVAATAIPRERYNSLLREFLAGLKGIEGHSDYRARIMVVGGELDNPEYMRVIESQGGLVVTDSLCFGTRMFWEDIDETLDDPLLALAQYYVADRPSCPRVYGKHNDRAAYIKKMIDMFHVDGVIFERLAFCDVWGFEQFSMAQDFNDWGIPLLSVDREYTLSGIGQMRTRFQAFMETIGR